MSYPFINIYVELALAVLVVPVGTFLLGADQRPLREIGLTLITGGAVLALPGVAVWVIWATSKADDLDFVGPAQVPPFAIELRDLFPHIMFGAFVVFTLIMIACAIRILRRHVSNTRRHGHAASGGNTGR